MIFDEEEFPIDFGHDHWGKWLCWKPDRDLNPQYDGIPDIEKCLLVINHPKKDGSRCTSAIHPDTPEIRKIFPGDKHRWHVDSWEPLTLSPSILCMVEGCGDHGFIRNGLWVPA